jgi:hypothetical protein
MHPTRALAISGRDDGDDLGEVIEEFTRLDEELYSASAHRGQTANSRGAGFNRSSQGSRGQTRSTTTAANSVTAQLTANRKLTSLHVAKCCSADTNGLEAGLSICGMTFSKLRKRVSYDNAIAWSCLMSVIKMNFRP